MKLTKELLKQKGFKFDKKLQSYVKTHEEKCIQIIISRGFFYPILCQQQEFSSFQEQQVSLQRIRDLQELENIWSLFTGGVL